ncbi:MAG: T9SS type A sorting domain-containing protein, partial [Flavobacteriales bacterium]
GQVFSFYGRSHDGCCGTFTATITNFNKPCQGPPSCQSSLAAVQVNVNGLTAPTVSGNLNFCGNNNATTTLTASGSPSGYSWWSNANGTGLLSNNASFTTPTLNTTTTYYVQSTTPQGNGCTSAVVPVVVTVGQAPVVSGGNNQSVCAGNSVTLIGSGASTYTWNNNIQNGVAFTPITTQTYVVTGTAANGCIDTASVTVTVNAAPDVNAGQDQSICEGSSVTLNGSGATSYSWNNNVQNGVPFTPVTTQTYTVTGTNAVGCTATDQVVITVNAAPSVSLGPDTVVCENNFPYQITATGNPGSTYSWDNGATGNPISVVSAGTYVVTITDNNGCTSTDDIIIESDPCAGIIEQGMSIVLYPNPFSENIQITSTEALDATLEVYGSDGRMVHAMRVIGQQATLNLANLARGNYMVKITHNGTTHVTKLVKQ